MTNPPALSSPVLDGVTRFVALDFEMTGHSAPSVQTLERAPRFARFPGLIIEIGAVAYVKDGDTWFRRTEEYQTFVNPDGPLNPAAIAIHGIKPSRLKNAPRFKDVADALLAFIGDAPIAAHSFHNERDALDYELARAGRQGWRNSHYPIDRFLCTQMLFKTAFPDLRATSLDAVCDRLWIDRSDRFEAHGALLDADLTAEALLKMSGRIAMSPSETV